MNSSIIDNQLNFALQLPKGVVDVDNNIKAGFDTIDRTWELIIKYSGDISYISEEMDIIIEELSYGYAIVIVKEELIEKLSMYPQIEYIEKPRRLIFAVNEAKAVSCINSRQQNQDEGLFGEGVLVAIIDSGIDYRHGDFRNDDGTTRILTLWDQTINGSPPEGFILGTEYSKEDIDKALLESKEVGNTIVPSVDISGHGTHVAAIACGNGRESGGRYAGVATKSELIVVKIGDSIGDSFPRTTRLLEALEYVIRVAISKKRPIVINLSFGNNYGAHNGRSLIEQFIDDIAGTWKNNICIGSGNEGNNRIHVSGGEVSYTVRHDLNVSSRQRYVSMQLWMNYKSEYEIEIITPSGESFRVEKNIGNVIKYIARETEVYVYYGAPTPISSIVEINVILYPKNEYVESGIWGIKITPQNDVLCRYDIWLGATTGINDDTGFVIPDVYGTLTIPSTAYRAITVGAYNSQNDSFASYSGRGYNEYIRIGKPDLVAPGVNIISAKVGGGYESRTGTSVATPFVTGSVALLMEWGIVKGFDRELYGEKVKAYLIKGTRELSGFKKYPNASVGWGALCLEKSFP